MIRINFKYYSEIYAQIWNIQLPFYNVTKSIYILHWTFCLPRRPVCSASA